MDYGLIAGVAGFAAAIICSALCFLFLRRYRASAVEAIAEVSDDCRRRGDEFRSVLGSIEANMRNTEELLRDGRLNRSMRSQALKMLRSGVSPETAAGTLGIASREIRLLSRVSEMLCR